MKKSYNSPIVKSEEIEIGVFGQYGSSNGSSSSDGGFGKGKGKGHGRSHKSWWMFW